VATDAQHQRFSGVEGLRGLAALGVLLSHVYLYASPDGARYELGSATLVPRHSGTVGVVLFFTLSGFLLYRPYAAALLAAAPRPSIRAYFRNRFLRVFPGYWLAVLGAGLILQTAYASPLRVDGPFPGVGARDPGVEPAPGPELLALDAAHRHRPCLVVGRGDGLLRRAAALGSACRAGRCGHEGWAPPAMGVRSGAGRYAPADR
jgi:hypothetical protein